MQPHLLPFNTIQLSPGSSHWSDELHWGAVWVTPETHMPYKTHLWDLLKGRKPLGQVTGVGGGWSLNPSNQIQIAHCVCKVAFTLSKILLEGSPVRFLSSRKLLR